MQRKNVGIRALFILLFYAMIQFVPDAAAQIFGPPVEYNLYPGNATRVVIADVNRDGKPDLVVAIHGDPTMATDGSVTVLLGNGDGTFQLSGSYDSGGWDTMGLAVGDVNGDGIPDVVVANGTGAGGGGSGNVAVLLGVGSGTFSPFVAYPVGDILPTSVAIGDINGDGKPDLVVGSQTTADVLLGNGDGTFQTAVIYSSGGVGATAAIADVNGDGKPDIELVNRCTTVTNNLCVDYGSAGVLSGNGDGTFKPVVTYPPGGKSPYGIAVADVNGDGYPDLLTANIVSLSTVESGSVGVLLGNGDGTFQPAIPYLTGGTNGSQVAVADVNGDGKPDLVTFAENPQALIVMLGNGNGTFQAGVQFDVGEFIPVGLGVGDVNGDGKPDAVVANYDYFVSVLINSPEVVIGGSPQEPLTRDGQGNYIAQVTITNNGNIRIDSAQVTVAGTTLGSGSLLSPPPPVTNLEPGASAQVTLTFPPNSVASGTARASLKVTGTYDAASSLQKGGNWGLSFRSVTL